MRKLHYHLADPPELISDCLRCKKPAMATYRTKWMNYLLKHHFLESYLIV